MGGIRASPSFIMAGAGPQIKVVRIKATIAFVLLGVIYIVAHKVDF